MVRCPYVSLSFVLASLLLASCGGGGGGSTAIAGLEPPDQISVVTPAEESALPQDPGFAPDSDYALDEVSVHVYDPSIQPLQLVNEILCLVGQTATGRLVNEGPYLAQVNTTICRQGEDESSAGSSTGQSSGANLDEFQIWTVNSERASNSAPQSVQFWIPEDEEDAGPLTIFVDMTISSSVDGMRPFGEFALDFAGAPDFASIGAPVFGGSLEAAVLPSMQTGFGLFFRKGDTSQVPAVGEHAEQTAATIVVRADRRRGTARVQQLRREDFGAGDSGILANEYLIAFDPTHFLRSLDGGPTLAFHRTEFVENVWRYNLYHAAGPEAGQRVELESGFGFRTADGGYGWIGYWGLWTPEGVEVANGDTVTRDEYGAAGEDFVVARAPGKLIRHTRQVLDLTELGAHTFQWWYSTPGNPPTNYLVVYATGQWLKTGVRDFATGGITPIDPPEVIDTATLGSLSMWSDTLGGPTAYVHGDTFLTFYAQELVNGSDPAFAGGDLELVGLVQCLRPDLTAAEAEAGDIYLPDAPDVASGYALVFQQSDLTLYLDQSAQGGGLAAVGLASGEVPSSGPYQWGMRSGALVADTSGLVNPWEVWGADEFYVWETGPNPWNQFTGLVDGAGDFVAFDPPLQFAYTHAAADERNANPAFDGETFLLNYGGAGQLWGLPQMEVDLDEDGQTDRWYPAIALADGTLVGPTGTEYVVKAIEIEQTLAPDPAYAGTLDLSAASLLEVPTLELYSTPAIGDPPVVEGPPRVVQGVVVGGNAAGN